MVAIDHAGMNGRHPLARYPDSSRGGSRWRPVAQLNRDHRRDLALRAAGYIVVRYTEAQVREQPEDVAVDLRRLLAGGR